MLAEQRRHRLNRRTLNASVLLAKLLPSHWVVERAIAIKSLGGTGLDVNAAWSNLAGCLNDLDVDTCYTASPDREQIDFRATKPLRIR